MLSNSDSRDQAIVITTAQLKEVPFFRHLPTTQLCHLATCATRRWFEADSLLFGQEENLDSLFVIVQGMVSVTANVGSQRTLWLYTAGPGSLVDLSILLDPPVAPVAVYTLSPVEVLEIPRECLLKELGEQPAIGYEMMQQLCQRLSLVTRVVAKQCPEEAPRFSLN